MQAGCALRTHSQPAVTPRTVQTCLGVGDRLGKLRLPGGAQGGQHAKGSHKAGTHAGDLRRRESLGERGSTGQLRVAGAAAAGAEG